MPRRAAAASNRRSCLRASESAVEDIDGVVVGLVFEHRRWWKRSFAERRRRQNRLRGELDRRRGWVEQRERAARRERAFVAKHAGSRRYDACVALPATGWPQPHARRERYGVGATRCDRGHAYLLCLILRHRLHAHRQENEFGPCYTNTKGGLVAQTPPDKRREEKEILKLYHVFGVLQAGIPKSVAQNLLKSCFLP